MAKGTQLPTFGPYLLRPYGCMDQNATWYGGRPQPRRLCSMGTPLPPPKKGGALQIFGPCLLWPNGWMEQDGTGTELGLSPGDFVLDGDPAPHPKRGQSLLPNFRPMSIVAKRLDRQYGTWHGGGPWSWPRCARWGTSSPPQKRGRAPQFSAHFYYGQTAG